jgi:hypothetical protein
MFDTWQKVIASALEDGTALTGTTAASILPATAKVTIPGNFLRVGSKLRVRASGRISNIVTTPGTLTLDVRLGGVVAFDGGAMQLNAVAKTNVTWLLDAMLTCRVIGNGTTGKLLGTGFWASESVVGSAVPGTGGSGVLLLPASAPAVGTGFDSTADLVLDLFGKFSLSGNSLTLHDYEVSSRN